MMFRPRLAPGSRCSVLAACLLSFAAHCPAHEPDWSWLDNGTIRVGVDLALGGAITWISRSDSAVNVVNSHDWGRQIQMSYYSGPVPFVSGDKRPRENWAGLGWNPIQVGDDFGNRSQLLEQRNDGRSIYVRCIPVQWPLENVPGECTFESWLELDGAAVKARARLVNARSDRTLYAARRQELPAVYTNRPWHRIVSYTGAQPFASDAPTEIAAQPPPRWGGWDATENWSALVDDAGWGLGVWNPDCTRFGGGFNGTPGAGGAKDPQCGYLSPGRDEILDHAITHEYRYDLVLGTVEEIRAHVYRQPRPAAAWNFAHDRQGWHYERATDAGWPIRGELDVQLTESDAALLSPPFAVAAADAPVLVIDAAFTGAQPRPQVFWATLAESGFAEKRSVHFAAVSDGQYHELRVRLGDAAGWRGLITGLRIDPADAAGGSLRIRSIRLAKD